MIITESDKMPVPGAGDHRSGRVVAVPFDQVVDG
jgi:hypothetical protein